MYYGIGSAEKSPLRIWLDDHAARRRLRRCLMLDPRLPKDLGRTPGEIMMEAHTPRRRTVLRIWRRAR